MYEECVCTTGVEDVRTRAHWSEPNSGRTVRVLLLYSTGSVSGRTSAAETGRFGSLSACSPRVGAKQRKGNAFNAFAFSVWKPTYYYSCACFLFGQNRRRGYPPTTLLAQSVACGQRLQSFPAVRRAGLCQFTTPRRTSRRGLERKRGVN